MNNKFNSKTFRTFLTIAAGAISVIVSVALWRTPNCDASCFYSFGGGDIEFIYAGGYWKIFTASFLHVDMLHLVGNLLFLWFFGSRVELDFGRRTWLILYFTSEFVARLSNGALNGLSTVGISGFMFAMFGYLLVADWRENLWRTLAARKIYWAFIVFIGMTIIPPPPFLGLDGNQNVAHVAHVTGFAVGLLLGVFMLRRQTVWAGITAAILPLAALTTLVYFPSSFWWQMAKGNEREVLEWQNVETLACDTPFTLGTDDQPRYLPVIINPENFSYSVFSPVEDGSLQKVELFIIDYDDLSVHIEQNTSATYANLYNPYLGRVFEIRDDAGNCLGRFKPEHSNYNILVLK